MFVKNSKNAKFNILPDDCIQKISVNGKIFPLKGIKGLCDYNVGAYLDFTNFVKDGLNNFEFQMKNHGGSGGIRIEPHYQGFKSFSFVHYAFALILLITAYFILKKFKFGFAASSLILLGIAVRLIYFSYTGPNERVYDMDYGHLVYINMIIENEQIPKTDECWSCNHPPLYYVASAGIKTVVDNINPAYSTRFLQHIAMLFSFGALAFGVAFLFRVFSSSRFAILASLLFVLWTGFVISASRIGNDVPFYFGALMSMFFMQMWWNRQKNKFIILAFIGAAIAVLFKVTGFVILISVCIIFVFGSFRYLKIPSIKILISIVAIILFSSLASQHRIISDLFGRDEAPTLASVRNLNPALSVNTALGSFIYFDAKDYFMTPYTGTYTDKGGRQYFWNFFLKSTLFGEYKVWDSKVGNSLASYLNVFNLIFFLLMLYGILNIRIQDFPSLVFFMMLLASVIFTRAYYSVSCLQDFRYVAPILAPMLLFTLNGANLVKNIRLRIGIYLSMLIFSVLSFLFIFGQAI
jgi:hypothetical protein